jgi:DNA polymerase I
MAEASRVVLNGFELRTDVKVVRWPDRYMDPRGVKMWEHVTTLVSAADRGLRTAAA